MSGEGGGHRGRVLPYRGVWPRIASDVFIAPGATVIGDVEIGPGASLWFGVTVRGDVNWIRIGARTNLQDGTVVHVNRRTHPTMIGADVSIGHMALIHGCTIEDGAFIGMRACVMDDVVVEAGAMVAAGALVTPRKRIRSGELWAGAPARCMRDLTDEEKAYMLRVPAGYTELGRTYCEAGIGCPPEPVDGE